MKWFRWDPRYYILIFLLSFVVTGQLFLGFFQKWDAFFVAVVFAVVTELLLHRWLKKRWVFPLSALISGIGISLILSSYTTWPYALASVMAIGMKYALRMGGSHIFNPNNVAVVFVLYVLPQYVVSTPKQWTNATFVMIMILLLGCVAAGAAKRLDTVLAFLGGYLLFALFRHEFIGEPLYYSLGPMWGASFQLFTFFMLTDPKTTPAKSSVRIWMALSVSAVDAVLRMFAITNSLFYAAFIVTIVLGIPYRMMVLRRQNQASA